MQFPFMLINNVPLGHDHDCIQSRTHTMSAHRGKAEIPPRGRDFRFLTQPV
jgi:hypothetical protein